MDFQCNEFVESQVSELIDSSVMNVSNPPNAINSEEIIASEIIEVTPSVGLVASDTFVLDLKPKKVKDVKQNSSVKERQIKAAKASAERPQAARDRLKTKEAIKPIVLPHNPGYLPQYLRNRMSTSSKSSFARAQTADSSASIQVHFKMTPEQEKLFDEKSVTSMVDKSEVEELKKKITAQSKTITRDKTKIEELNQRVVKSEKRCEELESTLSKTREELKSSNERNKSLEMQLLRNHREKKEYETSASAVERLESEIYSLTREKENLKFELTKTRKVKSDEILQLQEKIDKLSSDLMKQKSSCEILINEKNQLQIMLASGMGDNKEDGDKWTVEGNDQQYLNKIQLLEEEIQCKITEMSTVKEDNRKLKEEVHHFKSNSKFDNATKFQQKIDQMKNREEELCQQLLVLNSKLEIEMCKNENKDVMLQFRADYIRALHDSGSLLNARIVLQLKEIEELRGAVKNFEKFKLAHEEEKANLNSIFEQKFKTCK